MLQLNFFAWATAPVFRARYLTWDGIQTGRSSWAEKVSQSSATPPSASSHFPLSRLFPFFFAFHFGICLAGASSHGSINLLKTPLLPARIHLAGQALFLCCFPLAHPRRAQQGWVDLQEIRAWLRVPGQPWGSCCGRSRWGIQHPRLCSTFLCHGSAAKDRVLFPSLSPFPLLAPNVAPPRCQVSALLPRTFTQQWHPD